MEAYEIIKKPLLTEKSYSGIQAKVYTFIVDKRANKIEIAKAVVTLKENSKPIAFFESLS